MTDHLHEGGYHETQPVPEMRTQDKDSSAIVDNFGRWLTASGHAKSSVKTRKGAFKAAVSSLVDFGDVSFERLVAEPDFDAAVLALPEWQQSDGRAASRLLPLLVADREAMKTEFEFSFAEINPGLGVLGFAADVCGGSLESSSPNAASVDLLLVNLPFSAFVAKEDSDPEVSSLIADAAKHGKKARTVLFRIDWTTGARIMPVDGYVALISKFFPNQEVRTMVVDNNHFIPMFGTELFIAVSSNWTGDFRLAAADITKQSGKSCLTAFVPKTRGQQISGATGAIFPLSDAQRFEPDYPACPSSTVVVTSEGVRPLSPFEVMNVMGIPKAMLRSDGDRISYRLLGDSVALPVAERVLRSLLRAIKVKS